MPTGRRFAHVLGYAAVLSACGGRAGLGGNCSADNPDSCQDDLVCDVDDTCRRPLGAECQSDAAEPECIARAECDDGVNPAVCRLGEAEICEAGEDCLSGLDCFETGAGERRCFGPVTLAGQVTGSDTEDGVEGARVIALDEQLLPVTDVAVSDANGNYTLAVPILRGDDGTPVSRSFTLRADAADYQTFPGGIRQALPIDTSTAVKQEDKSWVIENALTDILLLALPAAQQGQSTLRGTVQAGDASAGVMVVAEETASGEGHSALSDGDGAFTIFNVPDGSYRVSGYKTDLQVSAVDQEVAGADIDGIILSERQDPLTTVEGGLQKADAPNFTFTSIVLAVKATFDPVLGRGDIPAGLRAPRTGAPDVTGAWSITGVPDGTYLVLAAFENDGEVRDPDTSIGGTAALEVTIDDTNRGTTISLGSFKVTDALVTVSPGPDAMEAVSTATPDLVWGPDSGNVYYKVVVFNAFGEVVWDIDQPHVGPASSDQQITYAGAALEPGMIYQFRVISRDDNTDVPQSMTEDLRGLFYYVE